jgi:hypothetical protein
VGGGNNIPGLVIESCDNKDPGLNLMDSEIILLARGSVPGSPPETCFLSETIVVWNMHNN